MRGNKLRPPALYKYVKYECFWHSGTHDEVIKWKYFPRCWTFVRGIHRSPVNSPHKGQWRGALMFSLICFWINGWVNNREVGDLRHYRAHYDVILMLAPHRTLWLQGYIPLSQNETEIKVVAKLSHQLMPLGNCNAFTTMVVKWLCCTGNPSIEQSGISNSFNLI